MDNLDKWIKKAESFVDIYENNAKAAEVNGDGVAESDYICEAVEYRILCGFLIELKQRRINEKNLREMAQRIMNEVKGGAEDEDQAPQSV